MPIHTATDSEAGVPAGATSGMSRLEVVSPERFSLGEEAARGGMGRIRWARDERLGRVVAIKELLHDDLASTLRFEREIRITARLQHPGIVQVLEAGRWPGGEPFYAMQRVAGRTLARALEEGRALDDRLALLPALQAVADALAYAHSEGVVHRDLKPSNVLLGAFGETVVIDWGLAKELAGEECDEGVPGERAELPSSGGDATRPGAILGTPGYMAPEQARGEPVDARTDVFALGAILYQVLVGRAPFRADGEAGAIAQVIMGEPTPIRALEPGAPAELVAIACKAMQREPSARYRDAAELAAELKRFQTGQLVAAHAYTSGELARRWLRRRRAAVAVALTAATLAGLFTARAVYVGRKAHAREVALLEKAATEGTARADQLTLLQARGLLGRDPTRALAWIKSLSKGSQSLAAGRTIAADAVGRGVARHVFSADHGGVRGLAFVGSVLVTAHGDGTLLAREAATGAVRQTERCRSGPASEIVRLGDSPRVAIVCDEWGVVLWNLVDGDHDLIIGHAYHGQGTIAALAASQDGAWLATAGFDKLVRIYHLAGGFRAAGKIDLAAAGLPALAFSPDGALLAIAQGNGETLAWDVARQSGRVLRGPSRSREAKLGGASTAGALAFDRKGRTLAVAPAGRAVLELHDLATGAVKTAFAQVPVRALRFARDGALWSLGADGREGKQRGGTVELRMQAIARWAHAADAPVDARAYPDGRLSVRTPDGSRWLLGHDLEATGLALSPDGEWLASAGADHSLRIWSLERPQGIVRLARPDRSRCERGLVALDFSASSDRVIGLGADGAVLEWPARGGKGTVERAASDGCVFTGSDPDVLAVSWDGRWTAAVGQRSLWLRGPDGQPHRLDLPVDPEGGVAFAPDSLEVAVGVGTGWLVLVDLSGGTPRVRWQTRRLHWQGRTPAGAIAVAPMRWRWRGRNSEDLPLPGIPVQPGSEDVDEPPEALLHIRQGPPEGGIAAPTIEVAGPSGRRNLSVTSGVHLQAVALSPDRAHVAAIGDDRTMRVFDVESGRERRLHGHPKAMSMLAFSPDGKRLAAEGDRTILCWDLTTGEAQWLEAPAGDSVLAFSPDGRILAVGTGAEIVLWRDDQPREEAALRAWMDRQSAATIALFEPPR